MKRLILVQLAAFFLMTGFSGDTTPPKVTDTFPKNGAQDVDPVVKEIWVKFDKKMMDKSYSWCYENIESFPQVNGEVKYTGNGKKNVLPVKLDSNKEYVIWINTATNKNFKDKSGNPAQPYKFTFRTK
jgi:hypothetical protein